MITYNICKYCDVNHTSVEAMRYKRNAKEHCNS